MLLLVSADLIASDYCCDVEVKRGGWRRAKLCVIAAFDMP